jgi:hypothetical protein
VSDPKYGANAGTHIYHTPVKTVPVGPVSGQPAAGDRAAREGKARAAAAAEHDRQVRAGLAAAVGVLRGPAAPAGHITVQTAAAAHADGGAR